MDKITYNRCVTLIGIVATGVVAIGLVCLGVFFVQWTAHSFQEPNKTSESCDHQTFDSCEGDN